MKGSDYTATQEHNCIGKYLQKQEAEVRAKIKPYHLLIVEYPRTIFYEKTVKVYRIMVLFLMILPDWQGKVSVGGR